MESQPASDSDETIVEGSVHESEDEAEDRRVERMLFIHKNAFQLYHTMSDFTSGTEAPFGGSSSPVIQMIPKTKCFRLHMENRQQQVKTLAYDESMQLGQSQTLLRSGVTCLTGVSSSDGTSPHVTHVDIEHNYSRGSLTDSTDVHLELLQLKKEKLKLEILNAKLWNKVLDLQKDVLDIQKRNLQSLKHPITNSDSSNIPPVIIGDVPHALPKFAVIIESNVFEIYFKV
ncbi:uncharacterized protein LOC127572656 [Pristis pectinata]|uniref:uncharacterized protein LOC127572656 n=1 Tax=Pristis pectinata TaxID=685728 RepID=UPI00223DC5F7|nr:uncharacterized protein LOC127572656 [Pristis pectinata]